MRVRVVEKKVVLNALIFALSAAFISQEALTQELASIQTHTFSPKGDFVSAPIENSVPGKGVTHKRIKRWLNGRPAMINIIVVNPDAEKLIIKPSYSSYKLNAPRRVKELVTIENAIAGINASYFKPDTGVPLGASVVNGEILTGPIFQRVVFGVTEDNKFKMEKLDISGEIKIGNNAGVPLFNINQPVFSQNGFTVYTDRWGYRTPKTSQYYCHIVALDGKIQYIKQSSVAIPKGGYVVVGPRSKLPKNIQQFDSISYTAKLSPDDWNNVKYAVGGGPYLIKEGKVFIDNQHFSRGFLTMKAPRTAVGYTKSGNLILVTVDGRQEGTSGATLRELANLMRELGAYNAMNFDGGSSTQMVYKGRIVNSPTTRGGNRVTNALVIVPDLRTSMN